MTILMYNDNDTDNDNDNCLFYDNDKEYSHYHYHYQGGISSGEPVSGRRAKMSQST